MIRTQLLLAAFSTVALSLGSGLANWALSYSAGCILVTVNFWGMAKVAQKLTGGRKGSTTALLLFFYFRLILIGLALFVLIAWLDASIPGLLVGLLTVVATVIIVGMHAVVHKS